MPLAGYILDQNDLASADLTNLAITGGNLHATIKIDDVLPAGRGVPIQLIGRR